MGEFNFKLKKVFLLGGVLLIGLGLVSPFITQTTWFTIIFRIRKAINVGDSGHLILAAASMCILYAIQSTLFFLGTILIINFIEQKNKFHKVPMYLAAFFTIVLLHTANSMVGDLSWEPISTILASIIVLYIFKKLYRETNSLFQVFVVAIQVFYAFQWLNIMPLFSSYGLGRSDIPVSIKTAGLYLQSAQVLNFTGFAFFLPFIFSSFITATLFISYSQNIQMIKENFQKEKELQTMKAKALETRIFKEVNSLVHDLKTPLVTIRGLNSLLAVSKDQNKLEEYSGRIDSSVEKMTEMISSFLYETSRQKLNAADLISYIRAQLPLEDDTIKFEINIADKLPDIYVNKIRMARAVINILENAIVVPCKHLYKMIVFEVKPVEQGLRIIVQDNGVGIKESDLQQIWKLGYSTNNTSGLGLTFAKQIIEDNKGTIDILSAPDQGTVVTIFLPSMETILEGGF